MWTFKHTVTTNAKTETIWKLYSDMTTWVSCDHGIEQAKLFGEFEKGTKGLLQPEGQDALSFQLTEVTPLKSFSDETIVPGAGIIISFTHVLSPMEMGTEVMHQVTITGENAEVLGPQIGEGFVQGIPVTMESLIRMAEEMEAHGR
jgi:hypothetical protein